MQQFHGIKSRATTDRHSELVNGFGWDLESLDDSLWNDFLKYGFKGEQ
ncbi:MAG: hypothetical protein FWF59_10260 [Turicibacter sp.]|nr:hypothetical protein [Turicibacter sp.]